MFTDEYSSMNIYYNAELVRIVYKVKEPNFKSRNWKAPAQITYLRKRVFM